MDTFPNKIWNPFIQLDYHKGTFLVPPSPVPVPGCAWHIGAGILAQACILWSSKENMTVFADNITTVSVEHKSGLIPPHLNIIPIIPPVPSLNLEFPVKFFLSENECKIAVSSVTCPQGDIAVSIFMFIGINWACNDLPFKDIKIPGLKKPVGCPGINAPTSILFNWGTVIIGFTWKDLLKILKGLLYDYTIGLLIDFLINVAFAALGELIPKMLKSIRISMKRLLLKSMRILGKKEPVLATQQIIRGVKSIFTLGKLGPNVLKSMRISTKRLILKSMRTLGMNEPVRATQEFIKAVKPKGKDYFDFIDKKEFHLVDGIKDFFKFKKPLINNDSEHLSSGGGGH